MTKADEESIGRLQIFPRESCCRVPLLNRLGSNLKRRYFEAYENRFKSFNHCINTLKLTSPLNFCKGGSRHYGLFRIKLLLNSFEYFSVASDVENDVQSLVDIYYTTCFIDCTKISCHNQIQTVRSTVNKNQPRIISLQFSSNAFVTAAHNRCAICSKCKESGQQAQFFTCWQNSFIHNGFGISVFKSNKIIISFFDSSFVIYKPKTSR